MKLLIIFLWMFGIIEERALELRSGPDPASARPAWLHPLLRAGGLHFSAQLPTNTPASSAATILGSVFSTQQFPSSHASILTCNSHSFLN